MTGPTSSPSTNLRPAVAWFAVALAGYGLYGIRVLDPRTLFTLDAAVKLLEAHRLLGSGFTSLSLSYPAATINPGWQFFPFLSPWVFHAAGGWQGVFPSAVAVLMAPAVALGVSGVVAVSALSGAAVVALVSTASPAAPRWSAPLLLGAGTFLWFFSVLPWEHATALALSTWAWLRLVRSTEPAPVAAAGLATAAAAALRDESLLLVPGLLWLLWRDRRGLSSWVTLLVATSAPLALLAIVDVTVFMRPPFAHVAHAVDIAARWLGTPPGVPHRPGWPLSRRYETLVSFWIVGEGGAVYSTVFVVALVSINLWRRTEAARMGVLGVVILGAVQLAHDLRQFLPHPDFPAGLLRLSPVLIFALLPSAGGQRASPVRAAAWVTCAGFAGGVLAFLTTDGGPGYRPAAAAPGAATALHLRLRRPVELPPRGRDSVLSRHLGGRAGTLRGIHPDAVRRGHEGLCHLQSYGSGGGAMARELGRAGRRDRQHADPQCRGAGLRLEIGPTGGQPAACRGPGKNTEPCGRVVVPPRLQGAGPTLLFRPLSAKSLATDRAHDDRTVGLERRPKHPEPIERGQATNARLSWSRSLAVRGNACGPWG